MVYIVGLIIEGCIEQAVVGILREVWQDVCWTGDLGIW